MTYTCRRCSKQFQSAEALEQHHKAAHHTLPAPSARSPAKKYAAGIIVLVILGLIGYGAATLISPASEADRAFAQCITDSGALFYGAYWCPHCQDQKTLFGKAAKYLPYVECSNSDRSQKAVCTQAGINAYPTWVFADGTQANMVTKLELSRRTGCPLPTA